MNKEKTYEPGHTSNRYVAGISWRLFGTLALFVILILIVIWIFQVLLLNRFYETAKYNEFVSTEDAVFSSVDTDNEDELRELVFVRSVDTDTCINNFKCTCVFIRYKSDVIIFSVESDIFV